MIAAAMSVLLYLDRFCVSFAADFIKEDLQLTQTQVGYYLSSFFFAYALAQVPAGWLSDRYGARIMLAIYIVAWSIFTAMIGAVHSFMLLLFTRMACGLAQAGAYPTSASLLSKWVPFRKRGTASAWISLGGRLGGAIAPLLTAYLIVLFVPVDTPVEFRASTARDSAPESVQSTSFQERPPAIPQLRHDQRRMSIRSVAMSGHC
jgi:ACS family glucarate transporter-like MFS transporter